MQVRITKPIVECWPIQWTQGQVISVPDEFGLDLIDRGEAVEVPVAEHAVLPKPETAIVPRQVGKPKPPAKLLGRRRA